MVEHFFVAGVIWSLAPPPGLNRSVKLFRLIVSLRSVLGGSEDFRLLLFPLLWFAPQPKIKLLPGKTSLFIGNMQQVVMTKIKKKATFNQPIILAIYHLQQT